SLGRMARIWYKYVEVASGLCHGFLNEFGCFAEQDCGLHFESAFVDKFLGFHRVCSLQANDDGDVDVAEILIRIDYALCYAVAANNTSENVDEDCLDIGIFKDDLEACFHSLCVGGSAYVEEVGGLTTAEFDHVHGGHSETGAVNHATNVTIEFHEVEVVLTGFNFGGIFFSNIAE